MREGCERNDSETNFGPIKEQGEDEDILGVALQELVKNSKNFKFRRINTKILGDDDFDKKEKAKKPQKERKGKSKKPYGGKKGKKKTTSFAAE